MAYLAGIENWLANPCQNVPTLGKQLTIILIIFCGGQVESMVASLACAHCIEEVGDDDLELLTRLLP